MKNLIILVLLVFATFTFADERKEVKSCFEEVSEVGCESPDSVGTQGFEACIDATYLLLSEDCQELIDNGPQRPR